MVWQLCGTDYKDVSEITFKEKGCGILTFSVYLEIKEFGEEQMIIRPVYLKLPQRILEKEIKQK